MKKIIALLLMITVLATSVMPVFASDNFNDISGHWAESEIEKAFESGIVNGYEDGSFRPDATVTRAEYIKMFVSMVCNVFDVEIPAEYDLEDHWAAKYYVFGIQSGALAYDTENSVTTASGEVSPGIMQVYDADFNIERWEMAFMVSNMMYQFATSFAEDAVTFSDLEKIAEYPESVSAAIKDCALTGVIKGDESGNFNPSDCGTRAETVVIVNRMQTMLETAKAIDEAQTTAQAEAAAAAEKEINDKVKTYTEAEILDKNVKVKFTMENGKTFTMELYPEYAPQTVTNFVSLVKSGFYDGLTFHRVIEGFMAQGGDPEGTGMGGAENNVYGEFSQNGWDKNTLSHTEGVVSMARNKFPNSASSQFFICYGDCSQLDGQYAAFGKVIDGMETVEEFLTIERNIDSSGTLSMPSEPIVIKSAKVVE